MSPNRKLTVHVRRALPWAVTLSVAILCVVLAVTIGLTRTALPWAGFLTGVLVAACIALASSASNNARRLARRTAELEVARARLAAEAALRARAEQSLGTFNRLSRVVDDDMPATLAYVDGERHVRYHNRAYAEALGSRTVRFEGRALREVLGEDAYLLLEPSLDRALAGEIVRDERVSHTAGVPHRVVSFCLPHLGPLGTVLGVFLVAVDVTSDSDLAAAAPPEGMRSCTDEFADELTGWHDVADRLRAAMEDDEFVLLAQPIVPAKAPGRPMMHEVLLRLQEEEENMMPPGAFLPLAERFGLLPALDRWVVKHLAAWIEADRARAGMVFSVNLSGATIGDPDFARFVLERFKRVGVSSLCFEIAESDARRDVAAVRAFMAPLKRAGCRFALCGVGRSPLSIKALEELHFDFVKIDGGLVIGMERGGAEVRLLRAIQRVARSMGMATIAECVETPAAREALRKLGIDYLQGLLPGAPHALEAEALLPQAA